MTCLFLPLAVKGAVIDDIKSAVADDIKKGAPKNAAVNVCPAGPVAPAMAGAVSITAATADNLSRKMRYHITGYRDDKKIEADMQFLVEVICPVLAASRTLPPRSVITKTDLAFVNANIAAMNFVPFMDDGRGIIGERTANALQKARVIAPYDIEKAPVISPGALVTIICADENMRMESQGRAEEQGAVGDSIKVRNTSSKKLIMARVVSSSTVRTGE